MKKAILAIALAAVVVAVSTCTKQQPLADEGQCKLELKTAEYPESTLFLARQLLYAITEKPSELKDPPKDLSPDFKYFLAKLADKEIPVILDSCEKLQDSTFYIDTDGDGDLSDEKAYAAKSVKTGSSGGVGYYRFGPIPLELGSGGGKAKLDVICRHSTYLEFYPAEYRVGKVRLGKNTYKVAVADGNFDGRYDKALSLPVDVFWSPGCDSFAIDFNGDGNLTYDYYGHWEIMPLTSMVKIEDAYYSIKLALDGTSLELERAEPEFGTLDLGGEEVKMNVLSDQAVQHISGSEQKWQLVPGKYTAQFIELYKTDSSGSRWTFGCTRKRGKLEDFEIQSGRICSFKIGPPFLINTTAEQKNDTVAIGFDLEGQAGELYSPAASKANIRIPKPTFKIINEASEVVDSGLFEYG